VEEVDTQLLICRKLYYITEEDYRKLDIKLINIRKLVLGLRKYINEKSK